MLDARLPGRNNGITKSRRLLLRLRFQVPISPVIIFPPLPPPLRHVPPRATLSKAPDDTGKLLLSPLSGALGTLLHLHLDAVVARNHVAFQEMGRLHHVDEHGVVEEGDDIVDSGSAPAVIFAPAGIEFGAEDGELVCDADEMGIEGGEMFGCEGLEGGCHRGELVEFVDDAGEAVCVVAGDGAEVPPFFAGGGGEVGDGGWVEGGGGKGSTKEIEVGFEDFLRLEEAGEGGIHGLAGSGRRHGVVSDWRHVSMK